MPYPTIMKRGTAGLSLLLAACTTTGTAIREMGITRATGLDLARFEQVVDQANAVGYVCRPAFCQTQQVLVAAFEPSGGITEETLRSGDFPTFTSGQLTSLVAATGDDDDVRFIKPLSPVVRRGWAGLESEARFVDDDGERVIVLVRVVVRNGWSASYASLSTNRRLAQANLDAATRPLTGG